MVKFGSSEALGILRRFAIADESQVPRHVEQLQLAHPLETNTLLSFRFLKKQYFILVDGTAEDDVDYIISQVTSLHPDVQLRVIENPDDDITTYGVPYKGKDVYLLVAESGRHRLDVWLAEHHPEVSRSTWQKHVKNGVVSVNGQVQTPPKYDVSASDVITTAVPDTPDFSEQMLPIIYMDENVIVIDKPAGILTHAKGAISSEFTVGEFFRRYCDYHVDSNRPGIIHRLDRDTSGVMIGARNEATAKLLQKQFADRKTKKTYVAIVDGHLKEPVARIDLPIGRNPSVPSTFRVDSKGKTAQTTYEVVAENDTSSLVFLKPETGRTHQLRVHMAYLNAPIHGDRVYGKESDRMYLHAHSLEITIPQGDRRVFTSAIPESFLTPFPDYKS